MQTKQFTLFWVVYKQCATETIYCNDFNFELYMGWGGGGLKHYTFIPRIWAYNHWLIYTRFNVHISNGYHLIVRLHLTVSSWLRGLSVSIWRLNGEDTEQKYLWIVVYNILFRQATQYLHTPQYNYTPVSWLTS